MTISAEQLTSTIRDRGGLPDDEAARRAGTSVFAALGGHLSGSLARRLAEDLPEAYAVPLRQTGEAPQGGGMDELYAAVQERAGIAQADVAASVGAALRALVEVADRDVVLEAREQLPAELRELMQTDTEQPDTAEPGALGPIDPHAPKVAGPDRPLS